MSNQSDKTSLAASTQIYWTLVESLPIGVILAGANGRHIHVNETASKMTGYTNEELMVGTWMLDPNDAKAWDVYQKALCDHSSGHDHETRMVRKDGTMFWVSISWRPVFIGDGEFAGLCTFFLDISDQKEAEEAYRQADNRYRILSENSSDMFLEWDHNGDILFVSESCRQLGYTPSELIGGNISNLMPLRERPVSLARRKKRNRDGQPLRYEVEVIAKDGAVCWLEAQADVVMQNGKPVKTRALYRDVTKRKEAEAALRESELKYKTIVENSADMIVLSTTDGIIAYASPATRQISGYEPEEIIGKQMWAVHPLDTGKMRALFAGAREGQSANGVEYRAVTKFGEIRWVSHSWSPIIEDGRVLMIVSIIRNITDSKRAQEALRTAHDDLEKAYKLQQEFINNVTHEVRTPLTAVMGYAEMLMEGLAGPVSDEQEELLGKVLSSSQHLLDVVNSVLQIARLKSGKVKLDHRVCNPKVTVEKCISSVTPQAQRKNLEITLQSDPSGCPGLYDEGKLLIILTNLLANAVKFTERGSVDVQVKCCVDGAEVIIADTGMGIASDDLVGIFDEFTQLGYPRKHKPTGFGIGLAIVATMVDVIGGSLVVSSEKGLGTAFTLKVPVLKNQAN